MRCLWIAAILVTACVKPSAHDCEDGRVCGPGSICDTVHHLCVSQDQLDQCDGRDDRTPCTSDVTPGLCDQHVCVPACGDGAKQDEEQCDDGNFINHDGCSSACALESGAWSSIPDPWLARWGHVLAYDAQRHVLVMFGGVTGGNDGVDVNVAGDTWERKDSDGVWSLASAAGPSPRRLAMMAYDSDRHVSVLFGGLDSAGNRPADTWEYDGTWHPISTAAAPPGRIYGAMAYNSATHKMVLYGGVSEATFLTDTWEYNGTTWAPLTTSGSGPAGLAAMAFDTARDHMVVFDQDKTWLLANDGTWTSDSSTQPPARRFESMTYVPGSQAVVMTAGRALTGAYLNDTWEYTNGWTRAATPSSPDVVAFSALASTGSDAILVGGVDADGAGARALWQYTPGASPTWSPLDTGLLPPPRQNSPLVYDPLRKEIVAYGDPYTRTTSVFDGASWHRRADGPPGRIGHAMTFDPTRGAVVAFGGVTSVIVDETWIWDGSSWSMLGPSGAWPSPRVEAAMAADPELGKVVMFGGGSSFTDNDLADTWELSGSTWTPIATQRHPAAGLGGAMVYDAQLGHLVLFDRSGATWEYIDHDWTPIDVGGSSPPVRHAPVMVYDSSRGRVVLYGGSTANAIFDDMWDFDGATWSHITYDVAPMPVIAPGGAYFEPTRSLVVFGGGAPNSTQQQWQFRYRSQQPDEACNGGMDEDGDSLVDCDDPDCACH